MKTITLTTDSVCQGPVSLRDGKLYTVADGEEVEIIPNGFKLIALQGVSTNILLGGPCDVTQVEGKLHIAPSKEKL